MQPSISTSSNGYTNSLCAEKSADFIADGTPQRYGYASTGESFSVSDPTEVWHMDFIGLGQFGDITGVSFFFYLCLLLLLPLASVFVLDAGVSRFL